MREGCLWNGLCKEGTKAFPTIPFQDIDGKKIPRALSKILENTGPMPSEGLAKPLGVQVVSAFLPIEASLCFPGEQAIRL